MITAHSLRCSVGAARSGSAAIGPTAHAPDLGRLFQVMLRQELLSGIHIAPPDIHGLISLTFAAFRR
ncbi:hypothetical protein O181_037712 [Austropuccinia psidii MF-1]|uniref:Uncharacterized protein n=1 Tax=Austropuccinia psidii MF-1 TaxID=1389203 RepID=A0A9Q3HB70_9BASI|nr:hypothetical protein [Austropuccinia psidii MF-1]